MKKHDKSPCHRGDRDFSAAAASAAVALVVGVLILVLVLVLILVAVLVLVGVLVLVAVLVIVHEDTSFSGCPLRAWCYDVSGMGKYASKLLKKDAKNC